MPDSLLMEQIELEKRMVTQSVENYRKSLHKAKQNNSYGCTNLAVNLISEVLDDFAAAIDLYIKAKPKSVASIVINRIGDSESVAYIACRTILNSIWLETSVQSIYSAIGQSLEYEYKMRKYRKENLQYYKSIQDDSNKRCIKINSKIYLTASAFKKKLDFHVAHWSVTERINTGLVLANLFVKSSNLVEFTDTYKKNRHLKFLVPTLKLAQMEDDIRAKQEVMRPLFLPMVCKPKEWTSVLDGGYISPYIRKNKLIKNNDKEYLSKLEKSKMPLVYDAINHLQNTEWQINTEVLDVVKALWDEGKEIAEIPNKKEESTIPFPYPKKAKFSTYSSEEIEVIAKWKRESYEIYMKNVKRRSAILLVSKILSIAEQFSKYNSIWFPFQMDFRGRLYPIPVLLQPQGSDLAKGLLRFSKGKKVDNHSIDWLKIHGANIYGYDKESYQKRIEWVEKRHTEIQSYAQNPLRNRGWANADKPFQFLAFCFEYSRYLESPEEFETHIPVLLDGTCNGLQHYSALLRDSVGGAAVNLLNSSKPNDIYAVVADKLKEKLIKVLNSSDSDESQKLMAEKWLALGINRKLTKRPVMVLPYGGTMMSCREYISDYLSSKFDEENLRVYFDFSDSLEDFIFRSSLWLSKYLWQSIQETVQSASLCMNYIRKIARSITAKNKYLEWKTPVGLTVRQAYSLRMRKEIKTELYGSILKTNVNIDKKSLDSTRQINGICPNFIHSIDAACLMIYIVKCKNSGIENLMTIHDCYGTYACDTELSARLLREAFVEVYRQPILEKFSRDILGEYVDLSELPKKGDLDIEGVLQSSYFFS